MSCNKRHCCDNPQQGVLGSKHTIVIETDDSIEAINGKIIAITDKGVYYSSNKGISWISRNSSSQAKTFIAIQDAGRTIPPMKAFPG